MGAFMRDRFSAAPTEMIRLRRFDFAYPDFAPGLGTSCVRRVGGTELPARRDLVPAQRVRATYSAQGATSFPHVKAVPLSLEDI
jgi:hypothetical protein